MRCLKWHLAGNNSSILVGERQENSVFIESSSACEVWKDDSFQIAYKVSNNFLELLS